jgi:phospholipid/cholesterol/gamma-HCH transport system substrate-binding protein
METRARYALIGLFMLAIILASFAFVYWLENKGGFAQRETYKIRFDGSVSGLLVGSAVLFNGIRVGEVTQLALDPQAPQQVIATIAVDRYTPIRADTKAGIESQGLTGGAAVTLRGGSGTAPLVSGAGDAPPMLLAQPGAGQDWTQAARDAFQRVDSVLAENAEALNNAITNIDTFTDALARNSDKVDGILAGLERMTGGGAGASGVPVYDLATATDIPPAPEQAPSWQLVIPEPTTAMGFNTDRILLQPAEGESKQMTDARWNDNLPVLIQTKLIQSFENAGYAQAVTRTQEGMGSTYKLLIDIRRFHIATAGEPKAEIGVMAKILDGDGKIVGAKLFEMAAPAKGTDAQAYVNAFEEAFGRVQTELLQWSAATLDTAPPLADEPPLDEPPAAEPPAPEPPAPEPPAAEPSADGPDRPTP